MLRERIFYLLLDLWLMMNVQISYLIPHDPKVSILLYIYLVLRLIFGIVAMISTPMLSAKI